MTTTTSATDNPASAIYAALNGTSGSTASSKTSDMENRFLKMLTAQLKNQDPLNPVDNAEMTSQMAQISTVDGIERLNATLQSLISDSSNSQALQAAAMVGHGVLVPGNSMALQSGSAFAGIDLASAADDVIVTITDSNGLQMNKVSLGSLDAGSHTFSWDGMTSDGIPAADGNYTFTATARQGSSALDATALSLGLVTSITRSNTGGLGINVGQQTFALADVRQIL